jgi:hypothetical protein
VQDIKTPLHCGVASCAFRAGSGSRNETPREMCHSVHLPAGLDGCSIRFAYQAADAGHPKGAEQARREQGNFADSFKPYQGRRRRMLP